MFICQYTQTGYFEEMRPGDRNAKQAEIDAFNAPRELLAARQTIEAERDAKLSAGVTFGGVLYQSDASFQAHITGIVGAINASIIPAAATVTIRSKGNTNHTLTTTEVKGLAGALLAHVQTAYMQSWAAKDAL